VKRGAVVGIVAATAAVVLTVGGVWWFTSRPPSAGAAAEAYLRALEAGDFGAIDALREAYLGDDAEVTLEQAFAGATSYIDDAELVDVRVSEDGVASVEAEALLGGESRMVSFALQDSGTGWRLTGDYLGVLRAETALGAGAGGDAVWVGDALAPAATDLPLLPAEYEVQAAPRGILAGSQTVAVSTDEPAAVIIDAVLSPAATELAQERIDAYADGCARPAAAVPDNCGLRVPWAADLAALDGIAFRVDEHPVVALHDDGSAFDATGGVIVATATGTTHSGEQASFTYRGDDWALRGSIRFTGDDMILAVR